MAKFVDFNDPFYRPLWLRIVIVGSCTAWALFEFMVASPFWGILFAAVAAWSFHGLFIAFDPRSPGEPKEDKE